MNDRDIKIVLENYQESFSLVLGVCKAIELEAIDIKCAVKAYEAGKKPSKVLKEAKSVIIVATPTNLNTSHVHRSILGDDFPEYKASREAAKVISSNLTKLGYKAKISVGISLKNAAVLCGIGVYGKNALILNPIYGTRLRMCAVLTDWIPTEYGRKLNFNPCEACTLCLEACKHNCLSPYVVDGPKCFCKYIDKSTPFSLDLPMCIDCQIACPYNK